MDPLQKIVEEACQEVEWTDKQGQKHARGAIKRWWSYIWGEHNWRDSLLLFQVPLSPVTEVLPAGAESVGKVYDVPCEDILVLANAGMWQDPTHLVTEFQRNPDNFTSNSASSYSFIPCGTGVEDGTRRIRLLNPPAESEVVLLVLGKKDVPDLSADTDKPCISGADVALYSYAVGELLRGRRKYSSGNARLAEAAALVTQMWDKETRHAAHYQPLVPDVQASFVGEDILGGNFY